ncbi:helix-turn-helix domain-containing protein [Streptomyces californicus]|uniref:helix-turn-helix domain-containing protein n=1 Tax=Streptomyces californicus TaxID=67351 RepID=UPI0037F79D97
MATDGQARTMSALVGEQIRRFREARDIRQEDIANGAREYGFSWGRSSVAALEAGNRDLSAAELLLLPSIIRKLGGWDEPLIPPTARIKLNESLWISPSQVPSYALALVTPSSIPQHIPLEEEDELGLIDNDPGPDSVSVRQNVARRVLVFDYVLLSLWPEQRRNRESRNLTHGMEIAKKVADRIVTPSGSNPAWQLVQVMSLGLWGQSIGDERDARAAARGDYQTKRALQSARGHVTRELIEEMQAEINERWGFIQQAYEKMEGLIGTEEGLTVWEDEVSRLRHPDWYSADGQALPDIQVSPSRRGFMRRRK